MKPNHCNHCGAVDDSTHTLVASDDDVGDIRLCKRCWGELAEQWTANESNEFRFGLTVDNVKYSLVLTP